MRRNYRMNKKRMLAMLLTLAIVLGMLPSTMLTVSAANIAPTGFTQTAINTAVNSAGNGGMIDLSGFSTSPTATVTITIPDAWTFTIKGNSGATFAKVAVACEGNNALTIENLNIKPEDGQALSALRFAAGSNTLTLVGTNSITSGQTTAAGNHGAAVGVPRGVSLNINGTGAVTATGGSGGGAGIGGNGNALNGGDIIVSSGTVMATGGSGSTNYNGGAGIGGATIEINGGTVEAVGTAQNSVSGVGGSGIYGAAITISGGTVTATGAYGGAGIGCRTGTVTISGGTVTATGGRNCAGIGGTGTQNGGTITINNGTVTATGGYGGAGIGGGGTADNSGNGGSGGTITINGGTITAAGGTDGAGIGGGSGTNVYYQTGGGGGTITINGGKVKATRGGTTSSARDIGNGGYWGAQSSGTPGTLTITGGSVWPGSTSNWFNDSMPTNGTTQLYRLTVVNSGIDADTNITSGSYIAPINHDGNKSYLWLPVGMNLVTANVREDLQRQNAFIVSTHLTQLEFVANWTWEQVQPAIDNAKNDDVIDLSGLSSPSNTTYSTLIIPENKKLTIKGDNALLSNTSIECMGNNALTIENLNIKSANGQAATTLLFAKGSNTLTLKGSNAITSGQTTVTSYYGAAVGVRSGITLDINGTGALTATGAAGGTGIGGNGSTGYTGGTINVSSGTVTAIGGSQSSANGGAGIGGTTIEISGGTVIATGGTQSGTINGGAGISGTTITIRSGTVTATGAYGGVGIGGRTGTVIISGGTVTATGGRNCAGIGGIGGQNGGTITINNGTVTATGGYGGAGIGGGGTADNSGNGGSGGIITINGGTITADGGIDGAGIGGGSGTNSYFQTGGGGGTITISGGKVKATRGGTAASTRDIGNGGYWSTQSAGTLKVTGGSVWPGSTSSDYWFNDSMPTNGTTQLYRLTVINDGIDANTNITSNMSGYTYTAPIDHDNKKSYIWLPADDVALKAKLNGTENTWSGRNLTTNDYSMTLSSHANALVTTINNYSSGAGTLTAKNNGNNTVTVTGERTGVTSMLRLDIDSSVTVIWNAKISGTITGTDSIIALPGNGTFEVGTGGLISNGGSGRAISATGDNATINITGGTVESTTTNGYACYLDGSNTTVNVTGGKVTAVTTGRAIYAAKGNIVILGGTITVGNTATTTNSISKAAGTAAKGYYIGNCKTFFDGNFIQDTTLFNINTIFMANETSYAYSNDDATYYYVVATLSDKFDLTNATVTVKNANGMYTITDGGRTITFNQVMNIANIVITVSGAKIGNILLPDFTTPEFGVNIEIDPCKSNIEEATVQLSMAYNYIYGGEAKTPGIDVLYQGSTLMENVDYTLEFSDNINAGIASVTVLGIHNYTGAKKTTFNITPKSLNIEEATHTKEYDGEITANDVSLVLGGLVSSDSSNLSVGSVTASYTNKNAGTTTIDITDVTLTGKASGNYTVTLKNGVNVVGISPKSVIITPDAEQSKTYGADDSMLTYTNTELIGEDTISIGALSHNGKDVGTHSFTIGTLSAGSNYALTIGGVATFEIKQATVNKITTVVGNVTKTAFDAKDAVTTADIVNLAELPAEVAVETNVGKTATLPIEWTTNNAYNAKGTTYTFTGTLNGNTNIANGNVRGSVTVRVTAITPTPPTFVEAFVIKDPANNAATVTQLGESIFPTSGSVEVRGESVDYTIIWGTGTLDLRYAENTQTFSGTISYTNGPDWLTLPTNATVTRTVTVVDSLPTYTLAFEGNPEPSTGFADLAYGYTTGSSVTYTLKNTGNQTITNIEAAISTGDDCFTVGAPSVTTLEPDGTASITVTSKTGLNANETAAHYSGTLKITWTGGDGATGITQSLSQTVDKAIYSGTKTGSKHVLAGAAKSDITVTLPTIPDDAEYGAISFTTNGLVTGAPSIAGRALTFDVASKADETTDIITILVTGAANYEDYNIEITVTAKALSAEINGNVTGFTGSTLAGAQDVTVTLIGDTFATTLSGDWITNLPEGLAQSVTRESDATAKITVTGTPTAASSDQILVTIPSGALVTNNSTNIDANASDTAKYYIQVMPDVFTLDFEGNPEPDTGFATLTYGYATGSSVTYTFKNTGNQTINGIEAAISTGGDYFTTGMLSNSTLAPNETATVIVTSKTGLNANEAATVFSGTLNITWTGGDGTTGITQSLTQAVNKATITITAEDKNAKTGDAAPAYTYKVSGLASGEILKTEPKLTCAANMSKVGNYTITPSGAVVPDGGNYNDIVYSNGTLTVGKSTPAAPARPTVKGTPTTTAITLNTIAGAEYSRNAGVTWQDSPSFTGLTPNTEYTFIARIKATADINASANSPASAKIKTAVVPVQQFTIKATSENTKYGTVTGGKVYTKGTSVTLTAKPKAGYRFVRWTEGSKTVSSNYQFKFTAQKNRTFKAVFAKIGTPKINTSRKNATSITVRWGKVTGANAYEVYRKGPGEKKYKLVKTVKGVTFTDTKLKRNKAYSYRVRVKCVVGKTTTYGNYSAVKTVR